MGKGGEYSTDAEKGVAQLEVHKVSVCRLLAERIRMSGGGRNLEPQVQPAHGCAPSVPAQDNGERRRRGASGGERTAPPFQLEPSVYQCAEC